MNLSEIKEAVLSGKTVCWLSNIYEVVNYKDNWNIVCTTNQHAIGLTWVDGKTLNGAEDEFYIREHGKQSIMWASPICEQRPPSSKGHSMMAITQPEADAEAEEAAAEEGRVPVNISEWFCIEIAEAIQRGILDNDEIAEECLQVWEYEGYWIQQLKGYKFLTVVGRDSEMGTFEDCAKYLNDNL